MKSVELIPSCVEYAKTHGPQPDDALAWCLNLAKWFKRCGTDETVAAMHLFRLFNSSDSTEDLDAESIAMHCKAAWSFDTEPSCNDFMNCESFRLGCKEDRCPLYVRPIVPPGNQPTAATVSVSDDPGTIGIDSDGKVKRVKTVSKKDGDTINVLEWVSDCALYIHTETLADDEREFIFEGTGAVDRSPIKFTMKAEDLADTKKFKAAMINAFGAVNRVGDMSFDIVQRITRGTIRRRRLCAPAWVDNMPAIPGHAPKDVEFKMLNFTPAQVYDGDIADANEVLAQLLDIPGPMPIIVAAILGSPIYAKYFCNDRFGVGVWGRTGSMKTSITKKAMCIYGTGYNDDVNLLKFGKSNSTGVGMQEVLAGAGILPQIIDNVKAVDPKDAQMYVGIIHSIIEGADKIRGKKDGGLRDSKQFCCTPVVTGEIKPDEASTSARILNLKWEEPKNKEHVDFVQKNITKLPVIGYHWLSYLSEYGFNIEGFEESRSKKTDAFNKLNYVNSGRLATIYCLLRATWNCLLQSPLKAAFEARTERFVSELDKAIDAQGAMVTDETEVSRFISGISTILATQPHLIQHGENQLPDEYGNSIYKDVIGRWMRNATDDHGKEDALQNGDLFLVPATTLNALKRLGIFTQIPTESSLTDALEQAGYLAEQKSKRRKVQQTMNGHRVYGWMLKASLFQLQEDRQQQTSLKC